jgi:hypothetical protein
MIHPKRYILLCVLMVFCYIPSAQGEDQEWKLVTENNNIRIFVRSEKDDIKEFKGEGQDSIPFEVVSLVLLDITRYSEWINYIKESRIIRQTHDDHMIVYQLFDFPWPFNDRDIVVDVDITRDYRAGKFTAKMQALVDTDVPVKKEAVRIINMSGEVSVLYIDGNHTQGSFSEKIDYGGSIPRWLSNMLNKKIPYHVLKALKDESLKRISDSTAERMLIKEKLELEIAAGHLKE